MGIIKVLKRKDGASLVVGVALGIVVSTFLVTVTSQLATKITNVGGLLQVGSAGWRASYLYPAVTLILQLIALELLIWIYVGIHSAMEKK